LWLSLASRLALDDLLPPSFPPSQGGVVGGRCYGDFFPSLGRPAARGSLDVPDIYACTHTGSCTYTHTRTAFIITCLCSYIHTYTYVRTCMHTCAYTHTRAHVSTYTLIHVWACMHPCTCAYTHTSTHMHTRMRATYVCTCDRLAVVSSMASSCLPRLSPG